LFFVPVVLAAVRERLAREKPSRAGYPEALQESADD
jgi:hypothetical protein